MAHVGAEVAVLGGVVFYFHRKNSQLQEMIVELAQANQKLVERITGLEEDVNYLGQVITSMQRRQATPVATQPVTQTPTSPAKPTVQQTSLTPTQVQETFVPPEPAPEKTIIEPLQVYDNNDDLDKELASELGDLQSTKVVCNGDTCTLVE